MLKNIQKEMNREIDKLKYDLIGHFLCNTRFKVWSEFWKSGWKGLDDEKRLFKVSEADVFWKYCGDTDV